ncbi:uncharacterized protein LOC129881513 [Solanum dulcamara]|uniref:uncharacterized protein LOC129881513 n=1 Tax=Solanum dulcamara TaxID=45834 RepID=UPI0024854B75|nr:uncharacterized protein LOC129881513 [Solanum dulcamara]
MKALRFSLFIFIFSLYFICDFPGIFSHDEDMTIKTMEEFSGYPIHEPNYPNSLSSLSVNSETLQKQDSNLNKLELSENILCISNVRFRLRLPLLLPLLASSPSTITISSDEYASLTKYQESMNEITLAPALIESGNKFLISSSSNWIIYSGAIDHMTGNPQIFSKFQSHKVPAYVTIANGSSYTTEGSGTVNPTSSITLSSVLGLPSLAFNL